MDWIILNADILLTILVLALPVVGWGGHVAAVQRVAKPLLAAMEDSKSPNTTFLESLSDQGKKTAWRLARKHLQA